SSSEIASAKSRTRSAARGRPQRQSHRGHLDSAARYAWGSPPTLVTHRGPKDHHARTPSRCGLRPAPPGMKDSKHLGHFGGQLRVTVGFANPYPSFESCHATSHNGSDGTLRGLFTLAPRCSLGGVAAPPDPVVTQEPRRCSLPLRPPPRASRSLRPQHPA